MGSKVLYCIDLPTVSVFRISGLLSLEFWRRKGTLCWWWLGCGVVCIVVVIHSLIIGSVAN